jgi:hypothetical protein
MSGDLAHDPDIQRALVTAYARILGVFEDMRRDAMALPDLLTLASLQDEMADKLDLARARLASIEAIRHARARRANQRAARGSDPGAGRSPVDEGQGCPALAPGALPPASAVGPATAPCPSADITIPDNPLFCARTRQELPEVNRPDNLDSNGELIA